MEEKLVVYKDDLKEEYAQREGITKAEALKRINDVFELIASHLEAGRDVKVANYFNFFVRERAEKKAVHPQTGEDMVIPATRTVVTKMSSPLKKRIQGK